jgi:hypothetical protein
VHRTQNIFMLFCLFGGCKCVNYDTKKTDKLESARSTKKSKTLDSYAHQAFTCTDTVQITSSQPGICKHNAKVAVSFFSQLKPSEWQYAHAAMCIYIYNMYVCVGIYIHPSMRVHAYKHIHIHIYIYTHIHASAHTHIYANTYTFTHVQ